MMNNKRQLPLFGEENPKPQSTACWLEKSKSDASAKNRLLKLLEQYRDFIEIFDESDLPNDDMQLVADVLGIEAAFLLILELGGIQLCIPKSGLKKLAEKYIRANFDGSNAKALAVKCHVSTTFVYSCLSKKE